MRKQYEQSLEEILSLSYSFAKDKKSSVRDEAEESSTKTAKKEVQDIILQMKKEGERLEFTALYGRDRQERGSKEGIVIEREPKESQVKNGKETSSKKALQKIDLEKRTGNENWLDEEDWLDE